MADSETGQVSASAARIYQDVYLPALFSQWCPIVAQAANIKKGRRVLDVACGTGALAIFASELIGREGSIVGVDINRGMLDIARSKSSLVEWLLAPAEQLPLADSSFDSVASQFGLMYFEDQEMALREMLRVVRPGGSVAVAVWDSLDNNPGLAAEERLWRQVFGGEVDEAPYRLGDESILEGLFGNAGATYIDIAAREGSARFDSIESWIHTGAKGWTRDDALSDEQLQSLLDTAERELAQFATPRGSVSFPISVKIVTARA